MRIAFPAIIAAAVAASAQASYVNVAFGRDVTAVQGTFQGAALDTLVDGVFMSRGSTWNVGTVYWLTITPTLQIDFGHAYRLVGGIAQGDDNDGFRILYRNMDTGAFETLWDVPNYDAYGSGMQTRPNPNDNTEIAFFDVPRLTDAVRIVATSGDNSYSLSEIQLFIPAPGTLLLVGLPLIGRRRR